MIQRFIKLILSEESSYLRMNHPNAFLLLSLIAERVKRTESEGCQSLEIGEAYIGDFKNAGIASESKYRTAKDVLISRGHIQVIETCRTRKNTTTRGTKVKVLRSDVWGMSASKKTS